LLAEYLLAAETAISNIGVLDSLRFTGDGPEKENLKKDKECRMIK
jgi:hypothetical protein